MSGRHSFTAAHRERGSRAAVVIIGIVVAAAVAGFVAALVLRSGSPSPKPIARANDAAAQSDARNAVSTIEQCYADTGHYPSAIDASTGTVPGCGAATLSAGDTIAYFAAPSADGYILSVTNTTGGASGKAYCYSSANGTVVALPSALTGWRASC
jgi:hypothetical protein